MKMIVIAALLQAIPDSAVPSLRLEPRTVEDRTYPQYDFDCRLDLTQGGEARLQFRQTGARGYVDENETDPDLRVKQTPTVVTVIADSANLLKNYKLDSYFGPGFGKIHGHSDAGSIELDLQRTEVAGRRAIIVRVGGVYSTVGAVGFCEVDEAPRAPLTAAETSEVTAQ